MAFRRCLRPPTLLPAIRGAKGDRGRSWRTAEAGHGWGEGDGGGQGRPWARGGGRGGHGGRRRQVTDGGRVMQGAKEDHGRRGRFGRAMVESDVGGADGVGITWEAMDSSDKTWTTLEGYGRRW